MAYLNSNINGDAGEYFVAYKLTRLFSWPCRMFGVDIGIDAELEVLDESGHETGNVIKIQVKAFEEIKPTKENLFSATVDERHVRYWKNFCTPVIVCAVDLKTENIYWKSIISTQAYSTSGSSKKVTFCAIHDKLTAASISQFRALVAKQRSEDIQSLFAILDATVPNLRGFELDPMDFESIDAYLFDCDKVEKAIEKIKGIIEFNPWRIGCIDWHNLEVARKAVNQTRSACLKAQAELVEGS